ncbi:DNA-3-methyladenine glycosylase family protein [Nakamurella sp. GG22]
MPFVTFTAELPVRAPFAADALLGFLAAHTVRGVEHVRDRTYHRTLRLPAGAGTVALTLPTGRSGSEVAATIRLENASDLPAALAHCRALLDLDAEPVAIDTVLAADPALRPGVDAEPGIRIPGTVDGPETLIRTMLGQQVSVAGAQTAAAKLVHAADQRLPEPDGELTHLFPTPEAVAQLGTALIVGPRRRAAAVIGAAAAMADGTLEVTPERSTADLTADLVALPGIGPWTAGYVAMRLLTDRDVLLTGDLVLRSGAELLGLAATPAALALHSAAWRPYRSYAGMHLWRAALATRARLDSRP